MLNFESEDASIEELRKEANEIAIVRRVLWTIKQALGTELDKLFTIEIEKRNELVEIAVRKLNRLGGKEVAEDDTEGLRVDSEGDQGRDH